jgi:predicted alpha/beta hydrolase family esterase
LNICFGSLLAREEKLFYPPSRFAKVVLKKVATSCGAATAFFSAALGTRRAKIAGAAFLASFFAAKERREPDHTETLKTTNGLNQKSPA